MVAAGSHRRTAALILATILAAAAAAEAPYEVVDTGQDRCFSATAEIPYPREGTAFSGQDAQYRGNEPSYRDNGDGTVTDLVTGLVWQKTPDLKTTSTYPEAISGAKKLRLGGHDDWRLPTIKELYSLIDFRGYSSRTEKESVPYLDTKYFDFAFGDERNGQRLIDAQYWSSTEYVGTTMNAAATVFGVNFADGRIKGYPRDRGRGGKAATHYVRYVRGTPRYGINDFADNGDGTITDRATGLTWAKKDSGRAMNWQDALAYAEKLELAGHDDWRLPNAKELQSIVDYTRAPDAADPTRRGPAVDPVFEVTEPESYYWTSTTHLEHRTCSAAVYIAFGRALGTMRGRKINVHGAGAQRSDPKDGDPGRWPDGRGPQGDDIRILNYVRPVRGGRAALTSEGPKIDGSFSAGREAGGDEEAPDGGRPGGFVSRLDKDGDGKVSRAEFDGPRHHFDRLDRNRDGFLGETEAPPGR